MANTVDWYVDFSGLIDALGIIGGVSDAAQTDEYIGSLINAAHNVASKEFDVDAAATAATGNMTHVYEFGTRGITRGTVTFTDPTDSDARLWIHTMTGTGKNRSIGFEFRNAVAPNPRPSAQFYGVPSSIIAKLSRRKYVFRRKAEVIEYGETVGIKPKDKPWNFVPFYGKSARNPAYAGQKYIFRPIAGKAPMESTPGVASGQAGTFTAFWDKWWAGRGQELMSGNANENFNKDVAFLIKRYPPEKGGLEPIVRYNSRGRIYNRRRKMKARLMKLGAQRGINRRR